MNNNRCSKCGGELISSCLSTGANLLIVVPIDDMRSFRPRYSKVLCDTCVQCGNIENIRAEESEKLR